MGIETELVQNNQIKIIWLDQPKGNKFTTNLLEGLCEELLDSGDYLDGIIITGRGGAFSVGGDLAGMMNAVNQQDPTAYVDRIVPLINDVIKKILKHPIPIIAAINGAAAGGGLSLAMACDYRIAVINAKLSMAFGKLGLSPDSASTITFPLRFGRELTLSGISNGKVFQAEDALKLGAINEIARREKLMERAIAGVNKLIGESKWTFSQTKSLLNRSLIEIFDEQTSIELNRIQESSKRDEFKSKLRDMLSKLESK